MRPINKLNKTPMSQAKMVLDVVFNYNSVQVTSSRVPAVVNRCSDPRDVLPRAVFRDRYCLGPATNVLHRCAQPGPQRTETVSI